MATNASYKEAGKNTEQYKRVLTNFGSIVSTLETNNGAAGAQICKKYKEMAWIDISAAPSPSALVEVALDRIKKDVKAYDEFIEVLGDIAGLDLIKKSIEEKTCSGTSVNSDTQQQRTDQAPKDNDVITKLVQPGTPSKSGGKNTAPGIPKFIWLLRLASIAMVGSSPLLVVAGIVLLAFSLREFSGDLHCDGVGVAHSLSVFNFFFAILCLGIPGLLITFILYFKCEDRNTRWEQKYRITRCLVWMNIVMFLVVFILIVFELLFSLLYIVPEVITHYNDWDQTQSGTNQTLCDTEVYVSSFSIVTISYTIVFLLLVVLGVYLAHLYFKWVTDQDNPGTLRNLIHACLHRSQYHVSP